MLIIGISFLLLAVYEKRRQRPLCVLALLKHLGRLRWKIQRCFYSDLNPDEQGYLCLHHFCTLRRMLLNCWQLQYTVSQTSYTWTYHTHCLGISIHCSERSSEKHTSSGQTEQEWQTMSLQATCKQIKVWVKGQKSYLSRWVLAAKCSWLPCRKIMSVCKQLVWSNWINPISQLSLVTSYLLQVYGGKTRWTPILWCTIAQYGS